MCSSYCSRLFAIDSILERSLCSRICRMLERLCSTSLSRQFWVVRRVLGRVVDDWRHCNFSGRIFAGFFFAKKNQPKFSHVNHRSSVSSVSQLEEEHYVCLRGWEMIIKSMMLVLEGVCRRRKREVFVSSDSYGNALSHAVVL